MADSRLAQEQQDEALLAKFGYKQELQRRLGFLSNFAVAFSYISVSTGNAVDGWPPSVETDG